MTDAKEALMATELEKYGKSAWGDGRPYYWTAEDWLLLQTTESPDVEHLLCEKAAASRAAHCASSY